MKKSKLLTTILTLGAMTTASPIVLTSCSSNSPKEIKIEIDEKGENCEYNSGVLTIADVTQDAEVNLSTSEKVNSSIHTAISLYDEKLGATYSLKDAIEGISIIGSILKIVANTLSPGTRITITILSPGAVDLAITIIGAGQPELPPAKSVVSSVLPEVNVLSNNTTGKEVYLECKFYDDNDEEVKSEVEWEVATPNDFPSDKISFVTDNGILKIKADWSDLATITDYDITIKGQSKTATLSGDKLGQTSIKLFVVPYNKNIVKYDGEQVELIDNIDPHKFEDITDSGNTWFTKKDGNKLKVLDWGALEAVSIQSAAEGWNKKIGNYFLTADMGWEELPNLTFVDLSGLEDTTSIGCSFLLQTSIKCFDGSKFTKLVELNEGAFIGNSSLESVVFKNNDKFEFVGDFFCQDCDSLKYVAVSGCSKLRSSNTGIGQSFLEGCSALEKLYLPNQSPTTFTTSNSYFMNNVPAECNLYTTNELLADYQSELPWKNRSEYIKVK